jgi:PII-like signaling protein
VIQDCLKLTTYFAERDRGNGGFLADRLLELYEREECLASIVLRGIEGFGSRQALQTDRLLTLSEDLPYVTTAVDTPERMQQLLPAVTALVGHGLITLERGRMIAGPVEPPALAGLADSGDDALKLTVLVGRGERTGGRLAWHGAVASMHELGVEGATAFLGVDGTTHGVRERARFFSRNSAVPVAIVAIAAAPVMTQVVQDLGSLLERPLLLLERVRICKLSGSRLATPRELPATDPSGLPLWQKLMVHAPEHGRYADQPLYGALIRRLRAAGAPGATALRGFWGYQGRRGPHGDGLLSPRRRVPVVVSIIDAPDRIRRWFEVIDEVTSEFGLVTSELVPAARGATFASGQVRLARGPQ